jgi:hypothetical protein
MSPLLIVGLSVAVFAMIMEKVWVFATFSCGMYETKKEFLCDVFIPFYYMVRSTKEGFTKHWSMLK